MIMSILYFECAILEIMELLIIIFNVIFLRNSVYFCIMEHFLYINCILSKYQNIC